MGMQRRLIWGVPEPLSTVAILEWELGSRTLADLLVENIGGRDMSKRVVKNRMCRANPVVTATSPLAWPQMRAKYIGKFLTLEEAEDILYECTGVTEKGLLMLKAIDWQTGDTARDKKGVSFFTAPTTMVDWLDESDAMPYAFSWSNGREGDV